MGLIADLGTAAARSGDERRAIIATFALGDLSSNAVRPYFHEYASDIALNLVEIGLFSMEHGINSTDGRPLATWIAECLVSNLKSVLKYPIHEGLFRSSVRARFTRESVELHQGGRGGGRGQLRVPFRPCDRSRLCARLIAERGWLGVLPLEPSVCGGAHSSRDPFARVPISLTSAARSSAGDLPAAGLRPEPPRWQDRGHWALGRAARSTRSS